MLNEVRRTDAEVKGRDDVAVILRAGNRAVWKMLEKALVAEDDRILSTRARIGASKARKSRKRRRRKETVAMGPNGWYNYIYAKDKRSLNDYQSNLVSISAAFRSGS